MTEHEYLSTGCLHGKHKYCQSMTGQQGEKRPGRCKFCDARCICPCHQGALASLLLSMIRAGKQLRRPEPE